MARVLVMATEGCTTVMASRCQEGGTEGKKPVGPWERDLSVHVEEIGAAGQGDSWRLDAHFRLLHLVVVVHTRRIDRSMVRANLVVAAGYRALGLRPRELPASGLTSVS
jgi:hypothetical protein